MKTNTNHKKYGYDYFNKRKTSNYLSYNFDQIYPTFHQYASILSKISTPKRVLDIGCAKGYFVLAFYKLGIDSHGIDISQYAIKQGHPSIRKKLKNIDAQNTSLPYPNNFFDLVVSCEVIEHLSDHKLFFNEIKRVLTPSGKVFLTTPITNPLDGRGFPLDKTHISVFPRKKWLQIFKEHNLSQIYGFSYLRLLCSCALGMSKIPAASKPGKFLEKFGWFGHQIRFLLLLTDTIFHYQTDIFLLKKA